MKIKLLSLALLTALIAIAGLPPEQQPQAEPQQAQVPAELEKMHAEHLQFFARSPGFGVSRVPRMPSYATVNLAGTVYTVVRPDLIALETKPVAYRNPGEDGVSMAMLTNKTVKAQLQTRAISDEESRAILELREGKDLVQQPGTMPFLQLPGRASAVGPVIPVIRVVGAMRATAGCARCHEVPQGTLLGAFSYTLVPANTATSLIQHRN